MTYEIQGLTEAQIVNATLANVEARPAKVWGRSDIIAALKDGVRTAQEFNQWLGEKQ